MRAMQQQIVAAASMPGKIINADYNIEAEVWVGTDPSIGDSVNYKVNHKQAEGGKTFERYARSLPDNISAAVIKKAKGKPVNYNIGISIIERRMDSITLKATSKQASEKVYRDMGTHTIQVNHVEWDTLTEHKKILLFIEQIPSWIEKVE